MNRPLNLIKILLITLRHHYLSNFLLACPLRVSQLPAAATFLNANRCICGSFFPCSNTMLFGPSRRTPSTGRKSVLSVRLIWFIVGGFWQAVELKWRCEIDIMRMNDDASVRVCKIFDSEIGLYTVFDVFLFTENDCKCMTTRISLYD